MQLSLRDKIYAGDSNHADEGQLECYYRRIIEEDKIPQENVEVYYLTIDGHSLLKKVYQQVQIQGFTGHCPLYNL